MRELALNLLDIVQNSIAAGASAVRVELVEDGRKGLLLFRVTDNGKGMGPETAARAADPFFTTRTTRDIGLGLSFLKAEAERTGGSFSIRSRPGEGTVVSALFHTGHIDMVPLGDMEGTVGLLRTCNPEMEFAFSRESRELSDTIETERKETA